jgi:hypothetical protein
MRKILITIFFCFFLLPLTTNAESLNYVNQQNHYSFTLPDNWIEMPKSTIDEVMQQVIDQTGEQFIDYNTGFQLEDTQPFQYPYILVQEHEVSAPSYSQISKTFESDKFFESVTKKIDEYFELMSNASLQNPFVDKERGIIFMNVEMDVVNIGKAKGLTAMFLGKESITQLNFYSVKSKYSENLLIFNQIIDSFRYEQGYEYDEEEAKKNDSPSIFNGAIEKGIIGGIMGLFMVLIMGLFLREGGDKEIKGNNKNKLNNNLENIIENTIYEELKNIEKNYNKQELENLVIEKLKQKNIKKWQAQYAKDRIINKLKNSPK